MIKFTPRYELSSVAFVFCILQYSSFVVLFSAPKNCGYEEWVLIEKSLLSSGVSIN